MKQNEFWLINLDPTIGAEISKKRPVIIVNDDSIGRLPLKIIAPVTDWKDRYGIAPWMVRLLPDNFNGLVKESAIDCFQIRSVSELRFIKRIGVIDRLVMMKVRRSLGLVFSIE